MSEELFKLKQLDENSFQLDMRGAVDSILKSAETHTVNGNNRYSIVIDCDEVLVNICDKWLTKASHIPELEQYFTPEVMDTMNACGKLKLYSTIWRETYYMLEWLGITDPDHIKLFNDVYFLDAEFYDDLVPSPFFNSLGSILDVVASLDILTMCGDDTTLPCNVSKGRWLHKYFAELLTNRPDIEFKVHFITEAMPKGQYLKEKKINFNVYVEDSVKNIVNVVETVEFDNFEILVPLYGYNRKVGGAIKASSSKLKFRVTGFHNTHDYTQQEVLDAFVPTTEE